jgi:hypothetical protein
MEGNKENQDRIRALEKLYKEGEEAASSSGQPNQPKIKVPNEVLDQQGYETYMDSKGQVLLRKREFKPQAPQLPGKGKGKLETRDPKDLEKLVQQVMRELPRMDFKHDLSAENAAALAKLDKEFDGKG